MFSEAHQRVQLADEGRGRHRVIGVVELVVEGQRRVGRLDRSDDRLDVPSHLLDEGRRLRRVARREPQLVDLLVDDVEAGSGVLLQRGDADTFEGFAEVARLRRVDDQIGLVGGDRLHVRLEPGEFGHRRLGRVVGLVVDGLDLVAGSDREQHLGRRRGEGHDALGTALERHVAVRRGDRDGELRGRRRSLRRCLGRRGLPAGHEEEQDGGDAADETMDHGASPFTRRRRSSRARAGLLTPGSSLPRPFPGPSDGLAQWFVSGSLPGHSGATVPDSHRLPSSGSDGIRPPSRPAAEAATRAREPMCGGV